MSIARIAVDAAAFERQQRKAGDKCSAKFLSPCSASNKYIKSPQRNEFNSVFAEANFFSAKTLLLSGSAVNKLIQTSKIYRHQFAYAGLLHGYAINNIYGAHGLFVVGYNNELRVFAKLFYHVGKLAYVGIIERGIYLI